MHDQTPAILVADPDRRYRAEIAGLLAHSGFTSVFAETGAQALAVGREQRPTLAVLEVRLPVISGYQVCRGLRTEFGESLPIILISGDRTEPSDRVAGLLLGADDYLTKPLDHDELLARSRRLLDRLGVVAPRDDAPRDEAPRMSHDLTRRELQVLDLLASGLKQSDIAAQLCVAEKTVSTHIQHILAKLGVHSRAQAVATAHRGRLVGQSSTPSRLSAASPAAAPWDESAAGSAAVRGITLRA